MGQPAPAGLPEQVVSAANALQEAVKQVGEVDAVVFVCMMAAVQRNVDQRSTAALRNQLGTAVIDTAAHEPVASPT